MVNNSSNESATGISNELTRTRQLERHGAASLRALSGVPDAEYRASRLRVAHKAQGFASPHLGVSFAESSMQGSRGIADSLGLRLRHSDRALHQSLAPEDGIARIFFDLFEQLRCESLADESMRGIRKNLDAAFVQWCQTVHGGSMADSALGILLYTVVHMVRARLVSTIEDETAEALVEATRANLSPVIGHELYAFKKDRFDQRAFAEQALSMANKLSAMIDDDASNDTDVESVKERHSIILPPDWDGDGVDEVGEGAAGSMPEADILDESLLDTAGGYHVYTTEFDKEVTGESLYREAKRAELRADLDRHVLAQAVSVPRLARELQHLFSQPQDDGWLFGQEAGLVDARRLAQLVSNPDYKQVFVQRRQQPKSQSAVTFLIDNSGSMKRQRFVAVATLIDTFCRALQLAGVTTEVLGFTTGDWNGGKAMESWRKAGMPEEPGRLGEAMHVVYKDQHTAWRRARLGMASLLETLHFREGIDGEALLWAYRRLRNQSEEQKFLVVISDGAPMDAATHHNNPDGFLDQHLRDVAHHIEQQTPVHLGAIGIDLDLSDTYHNSVGLDLNGTLGQASYRVLHALFAGRMR